MAHIPLLKKKSHIERRKDWLLHSLSYRAHVTFKFNVEAKHTAVITISFLLLIPENQRNNEHTQFSEEEAESCHFFLFC